MKSAYVINLQGTYHEVNNRVSQDRHDQSNYSVQNGVFGAFGPARVTSWGSKHDAANYNN